MALREPEPGDPPSRAEQQRATRDALVRAARQIFARDGYHGANLGRIAKQAGFSKGAVYSNFASKAELFLAVMDEDLADHRGEDWDPLIPDGVLRERCADERAVPDAQTLRGFALATLEFIAAAARSDELQAALTDRVQVLVDAYGRIAADERAGDERLDDEHLGALMTALDQGISLLVVSGLVSVDAALLRTGLRRLLQPAPDDAADAAPTRDGEPGRLQALARAQYDVSHPPSRRE